MERETLASSLTAGRSGRIKFANAETTRRHLSVYAERAFQHEKAAVTGALPEPYKSRWKKWCLLDAAIDGKGRPCYVLSPYEVPPGPHRTSWMEWFEQLRDDGCIDRMPHLVCYTTTTSNDSDLVYEVVSAERITEGYVRRQAAGPIRPPTLPPVVEFHEQILREDIWAAPRAPAAGSNSALCQETVANVQGLVEAHEMIKLDDDDDDDDDDEEKGNDDDSVFVDASAYETPRARKRKGRGADGSSTSKQRTSRQRNEKRKTATAGAGLENCGKESLLPPDSDRVRHLLSLGYKRWGRPTLLPNGLYKRPLGRMCNGYEFDHGEGLIRPISTNIKFKQTAIVTPSPSQAVTSTSAPANDHSTNGNTSGASDEATEFTEPAVHPFDERVASSVATAATPKAAQANDHSANGVASAATDEAFDFADPSAHPINNVTSTSASEDDQPTNGVALAATDEEIEVAEPVAHSVAGQVASSAAKAATPTSEPSKDHSTSGTASEATDVGIAVAEPVAHPVGGQVASSFATAATSTSAPAKDHSSKGVALAAPSERIEDAEPVTHSVAGHGASSVARSGCVSSHEAAKAQIVADLPTSYKERFQQTGFDVKDKCRVTIVSPFDRKVDTQTRTRWLKHLQKERKKGLGSGSELLFCVRRFAIDETGQQHVTCGLLPPDCFVRAPAERTRNTISPRADATK